MGHPISKFNPVKSRVSEHVFQKCGKQETPLFNMTHSARCDIAASVISALEGTPFLSHGQMFPSDNSINFPSGGNT